MKELDKATQAAVREINRRLQQQVRNDWTFPDPQALPDGVPALTTADPPITSSRPSSAQTPSPTSPTFTASRQARMRERYYGTTDDSSDEEAHMVEDMYAFDSPDTVGDELEKKGAERKKRKRKDLEDELAENSGLCFFLRRRNAWTGAVPRERAERKLATSSDSSPARTPTSGISAGAERMEGVTSSAVVEMSPWIPPSHASAFAPPPRPEVLTDVMLPLAPPLIPPSNPVRISLSSRSQSDLYSKIVRDSRTPAIPVNLADMTRIIVQGWKDEGNWPPRSAAPELGLGIGTRAHGVLGVQRVSKAIGVRGEEGYLAHHPHLQRGVEGVKRVFRLSTGSHHDKEEIGLKSPKSPKTNQDLESAFRSHE